MTSIVTNSSANKALISFEKTQSNLANVQNQISTGFKVAGAKDGAAQYAIATGLRNTTVIADGVLQSLGSAQALVRTTTSAIDQITQQLYNMQATLSVDDTQLSNMSQINDSLQTAVQNIQDIIQFASYNGLNLFTSGTTNDATISFLQGTDNSQTASNVLQIKGLAMNVTNNTVASDSATTLDQLFTYNGSGSASGLFANNTFTPFITDSQALTNPQTGSAYFNSANVAAAKNEVTNAITALAGFAATLGATDNQITGQVNFTNSLKDALTDGLSTIVDADMNEASTKLQALQTQQQLGIQALSMANQTSQLVLKLFQ